MRRMRTGFLFLPPQMLFRPGAKILNESVYWKHCSGSRPVFFSILRVEATRRSTPLHCPHPAAAAASAAASAAVKFKLVARCNVGVDCEFTNWTTVSTSTVNQSVRVQCPATKIHSFVPATFLYRFFKKVSQTFHASKIF